MNGRAGFVVIVGAIGVVVILATSPLWVSFFVLVAAALGYPK